ncbi:MAG: glycosyltransferase [Thermoplasmata archaeon]|nr:glycosyltransferase [Thermoplasmata archaeon]
MRIAMFTETYPPTADGVATYVASLKNALENLGHEVIVFTASRGEKEKGIHRHHALTVPFYRQYRMAVFPYYKAYTLLKKFRPDVVHLHTPFAVGSAGFLAARALRVPVVGSFHTNIKDMSKSVKSVLANRAFVAMGWRYSLGIYWRCNALTVPSKIVRDFILASAIKPFKTSIRVVWTLPELEKLVTGIEGFDGRRALGLGDRFVVTFLSRLTKDKGIYTFLECAEKCGDVVFLVGGTGPEERYVRDWIKRKGLKNVKFLGFVEEEKKPGILAASDVFVLPSFADTFGIVLIEAMACGAVAVGTDAGGITEFLRHRENGMVFHAGDVEGLVRVVRELQRDPGLRARLKENGRRFAMEHGSIMASAKQMLEIYQEVIASGWKKYV